MESQFIEYKSAIPKQPNKLKAEIVAFLNTRGGVLLLGVDDQGKPLPEVKPLLKEWEELISNWLHDAFNVPIDNYITIETKDYIKITILEGLNKPYFYTDGQGFNAKGVYIRIGSSSRIATFAHIERMIKANHSEEYENHLSRNQDLTFTYTTKRLEDLGLSFSPKGLAIVNRNNEFTNAGLLLSEQNPTVCKMAFFEGLDVEIFRDKKVIKGSIMEQLDDMLHYANLSNKVTGIITGKPQRENYPDYPPSSIREGITNAFCHRDWTLSGYIKVEFFDNRVQIYSPGSLPSGLTIEDIKQGMTASRNPKIVSALALADYIEDYASGVRRIFNSYEGFPKQPEYYVSENAVILTLYNKNYYQSPIENQNDRNSNALITISEGAEFSNTTTEAITQIPTTSSAKTKQKSTQTSPSKKSRTKDSEKNTPSPNLSSKDSVIPKTVYAVSERQKNILTLLAQDNKYTARTLASEISVSSRTVERELQYLRKIDKITRQGSNRDGIWIVN